MSLRDQNLSVPVPSVVRGEDRARLVMWLMEFRWPEDGSASPWSEEDAGELADFLLDCGVCFPGRQGGSSVFSDEQMYVIATKERGGAARNLDRALRAEAARDELRAALAELVRLRDLKETDPAAYEVAGGKDEAWEMARSALSENQEETNDEVQRV